jgi:hypothetical protein
MRKCFPQLRVGAGLNRIGKPAAADWLAMTSLCGIFFSQSLFQALGHEAFS